MCVSVAMASYNGEAYIGEQLESILSQLDEGDEVVVSDDGSSDKTPEIVAAIAEQDPRVKWIEGPRKGLIYNFENALKHCSGEYIFLSDQDDIWRPGKVAAVVDALKEKATLVLHDAQMVDDEKHVLNASFFAWRGTTTGYWANIKKNSYIGCCMAFRRSLLEWALPFPEKLPMHDQWLGLLAEKTGTVYLENQVFLDYRRHEGTATTDHHSSVLKMISYRVNIIRALHERLAKKEGK